MCARFVCQRCWLLCHVSYSHAAHTKHSLLLYLHRINGSRSPKSGRELDKPHKRFWLDGKFRISPSVRHLPSIVWLLRMYFVGLQHNSTHRFPFERQRRCKTRSEKEKRSKLYAAFWVNSLPNEATRRHCQFSDFFESTCLAYGFRLLVSFYIDKDASQTLELTRIEIAERMEWNELHMHLVWWERGDNLTMLVWNAFCLFSSLSRPNDNSLITHFVFSRAVTCRCILFYFHMPNASYAKTKTNNTKQQS